MTTREAGLVMREHGICISQGELEKLVLQVCKSSKNRLLVYFNDKPSSERTIIIDIAICLFYGFIYPHLFI